MIPIVDLKAQYYSIKEEIDGAIAGVLESSQFVLGKEVAAFEAEFAEYCGAAYAVGVNSGTSALHLALLAAGIGPGDEVITVPFTFVASVAAIGYTGARPVFVDIDAATCNLDTTQVAGALTARTKAILPVHLYGQAADLDPLLTLARQHNLTVIEDAAQAHGAEYKGRRVGGIGDLGCFSFYPTKNLSAFGEAGAVVTNNPEHAARIRLLRDWGAAKKYEHTVKGYNYRMEGLQGAVLRVKLRHLEGWIGARRAHAAEYAHRLAGAALQLPREMPYARHVYNTYTVRSPHRDQLQAGLLAAGVQTAVHYPIPVHLQPSHADLGYRRGAFPVAEQAALEVLSLPMYPELTGEQIAAVAEACASASPAFTRAH